ncbi:UNVERIFIED_CONTAM: putative ribonuclease H protein [Sesamum calycinum]|uniref:Ribonuclease H protein n=1 Tax=Sesamum calycinum TaxID=2727403 RepID=A0AAW2M0G4_9LAMI
MSVRGLSPSGIAMSDFHDAIADCALVDAGYVGSPYTWYSRRLRQHLDRVLIFNCWMSVFPKMQVAHLELSQSDHRGLLVEAECTVERKVSSFRFQQMWTTHSEVFVVVRRNWQYPKVGSGMMRPQQKLTRLKHCLKEWNKTVFGNVFDNVAAAERGLKEADEAYDQDPCDRTLVERNQCSAELVQVLAQEETFWRQKAGIRWAKDGERNTRYFHSLRLLTAEPVLPEEMDSKHLEDGLTDEDRRFLCVMSTLEEEIIAEDVFGAVTEFFRGEKMPKGFTATTISLIPKTASPTCWSEYRPISLCNVTNKICTKLMTIRLGHVLPKPMIGSVSSYQVCSKRGFPERWIGLVANAISHCWFSVLVNGLGNDESLPWRRLALIRSVLQATPLHLLQACFPVAEGGLGVRSLADYVRAFSMKLWWRFRGKSSLWSEYLHGRYYRNLHPTIVPYNRNHSSVWHRLCRIRDVAEPFIFWTLGEGSVSIWHDNWLGEKPLVQLVHRDTYTMESRPSARFLLQQARGIELCGRSLVWGISRRNLHGKLLDKFHLGGSYLLMSAPFLAANYFSFLWRLFQDRIPVDARMQQKGFSFPSKCQCCEAEETVSHLFIEIVAVQGVWACSTLIFGLCLCDTGSLTHMVHFWRYSTPFHSYLHIWMLIPFLILWFTWTQLNATKYHGVPFSTDSIILEVQRHLRTLYAARTLTSTQWKGDLHQVAVMGFISRQQVPRTPSIVRWHAPSPSWFKLNTDGSSLGNPGLAGAAGIIRDSAGHVHLAYQFALGTGTSVLVELTAVWRGMELALTHSLAPLVVEVDATTVISLLQSRASGKWEVQHMIMRIICLQQLLVANVQHVFREANGAADHLAKEAASLQLTRVLHHDDITGILRGILCLGRQGVPHLCRG